MTSSGLTTILAAFEKDSSFWLPAPRSKMAYEIEWAWDVVMYTSIVFFFIVVGAAFFFTVKYRRRTLTDTVSTVTHNTPLEIVWTLIPLILVMWFFVVGFKGFVSYDTPPSDALVIEAEGRQWGFSYTYPGGGTSDQVLYVPVGKAVRLNLKSKDVLHAYYIPNFHIGRNMIPGRTTEIWFEATQTSGEAGFPVYCTQYCGKEHSRMFGAVVVLEQEAYEKKLVELANPFKKGNEFVAYAEVGKKIYEGNCASCHTINGKDSTGPSWKDFWSRTHTFAESNEPGFVLNGSDPDEKKIKYLAESVLHPAVKITMNNSTGKPFPNGMSSFSGIFSDNANADPVKETGEYIKYQRVLAIAEYMKKLDQGDKYDASKAPTFRETGGAPTATAGSATSAAAAASEPATQTSPDRKP